MSAQRMNTVIRLVAGGSVLMLGVMSARVAQLQAKPDERVAAIVESRERARALPEARGRLLDRRGRVVSSTRLAHRVIIDPVSFPEDFDVALAQLSQAMGVSPDVVGVPLVNALDRNARVAADLEKVEADEREAVTVETVVRAFRERVGLDERAEDDDGARPKVRRYLAVGKPLDRARADAVRALGLSGVSLEARPVRERAEDVSVAALAGQVRIDPRTLEHAGVLGAEARFDGALSPVSGEYRAASDAWGRPLWIERGGWAEGDTGADVRLSIDLEITRIVREALERGVDAADAQGGRAVVVDPATGEVLAMADVARRPDDAVDFPWLVKTDDDQWVLPEGADPDVILEGRDRKRYVVLRPVEHESGEPALRRNRCIEEAYEPGSTFKPLVWALAAGEALLPRDEVIDGHKGVRRLDYGRVVRDVAPKDELTWDEVLVHSSNVGMSQLVERLSEQRLREHVRAMGFGRVTALDLPREAPGLVTSAQNWNHYTQTSIAMGYEIAATPVQMARAFSLMARSGAQAGTVADLRLDAAGSSPTVAQRVLPADPVLRAREPMQRTAEKMDSLRMRFREGAQPATYTMFGKSGTSNIAIVPPHGLGKPKGVGGYFTNQHHSSYVAAAPVDLPRIVVLVVIDDPGPALVRIDQHYGSWTAGPVVREIVERTLRYLGVSPDVVEGGAG